jgi:hypothetical protein
MTKAEYKKQMRNENVLLRQLIDELLTTKDNLAFFSGPDQCHEISEQRFVALEEIIDDLEDIYIARVNAAK